ncbi:hypothetical protein B0T49_20805 [Chromobacterium violaceum]|uniref:hypothetical protein n=1 Tax=Chromobacterium violaceum TaxID=536 RepID=UPI0009DA8E9B|nr:hypothetical protein [Chromobacterium violaceum]OQS45847.1 hypothetical protein B0T49_20805 [Chromobacterium violaceum]OQS47479.1 hypothetical protein B0T48_12410 [Chromobacterium violaceum]
MHHQNKSSLEAFKQGLEQLQAQLQTKLDEARKAISDMSESQLRSAHGQSLEAMADNLDSSLSWLKEAIAEQAQTIAEME